MISSGWNHQPDEACWLLLLLRYSASRTNITACYATYMNRNCHSWVQYLSSFQNWLPWHCHTTVHKCWCYDWRFRLNHGILWCMLTFRLSAISCNSTILQIYGQRLLIKSPDVSLPLDDDVASLLISWLLRDIITIGLRHQRTLCNVHTRGGKCIQNQMVHQSLQLCCRSCSCCWSQLRTHWSLYVRTMHGWCRAYIVLGCQINWVVSSYSSFPSTESHRRLLVLGVSTAKYGNPGMVGVLATGAMSPWEHCWPIQQQPCFMLIADRSVVADSCQSCQIDDYSWMSTHPCLVRFSHDTSPCTYTMYMMLDHAQGAFFNQATITFRFQ